MRAGYDGFPDECAAATRRVLESLVVPGTAPGAQYAFADATCRFTHVSGHAHLAPDRAVDTLTTFNAYSVAKVLTASAVILAAQQGRLDLDAPIESLLGSRKPLGFGTVRDTLLHRAGFPNPNPLPWVHADSLHAAFDEQAFVHRLTALLRRPSRVGEQYRYSNVGYMMLGAALEAVTGVSLPTFVSRQLIQPLGMAPTEQLAYSIPNAELHARGYMRRLSWLNLALGFVANRRSLIERRVGRWLEFRLHHVDGAAYGGLIANATGLVRLGRALIGPDETYPAALREAMLTPVPGPGPTRSLGWFCGDLRGNRWFAHAGGGAAYYCELRVYPDLGAASAVMLNRPGLSDSRLLDSIDHPLLTASSSVGGKIR
jgi:CubicO group peptidase (beta-lactamase class C family)